MHFGAHLPIAGFGGVRPAAATVIECAEAAEALGYTTLCANDHIVFSVPWIDGLVALGAAAARTRSIRLMTTASLVVVRGAAALGSAAVALAHLSGNRVTTCLTPGSTISDYEAVGIPFDDRWPRFEAAIAAFRSYLEQADLRMPVWVASWGSEAGCDGSPAMATAGSPPPTTAPRGYSPAVFPISARNCSGLGRTRGPSRTRWQPCTPMSRTIRPRRAPC
jgi:alkanesulfonate monooxygenase SsuD/methylene tetrahydromethanopterin reductase-like flavin-dependent oxidoreductase (luciferase family)